MLNVHTFTVLHRELDTKHTHSFTSLNESNSHIVVTASVFVNNNKKGEAERERENFSGFSAFALPDKCEYDMIFGITWTEKINSTVRKRWKDKRGEEHSLWRWNEKDNNNGTSTSTSSEALYEKTECHKWWKAGRKYIFSVVECCFFLQFVSFFPPSFFIVLSNIGKYYVEFISYH